MTEKQRAAVLKNLEKARAKRQQNIVENRKKSYAARYAVRQMNAEARRENVDFWEHLKAVGLHKQALAELNESRAFWRFSPWTETDAEAGEIAVSVLRPAARAVVLNRIPRRPTSGGTGAEWRREADAALAQYGI